MNPAISLTLLAKDCIRYSYPIDLCLQQHAEIADEVVIGCPATDSDGTQALIRSVHPDARFITLDWADDCIGWHYPGESRKLTDAIVASAQGDWILKPDADGFIHEKDFPRLQEIASSPHAQTAQFRFCHFAGSLRYRNIRGVLGHVKMTVFARRGTPLTGDGANFLVEAGQTVFLPNSFLWHTSYCRDASYLTRHCNEHRTVVSNLEPLPATPRYEHPDPLEYGVGPWGWDTIGPDPPKPWLQLVPAELLPRVLRENRERFDMWRKMP